MSEKQEKSVKLSGLRDNIYPKYNFLKQRLLSILPRFKEEIVKLNLEELSTNGEKKIYKIENAMEPFKSTVELVLMGQHDAIEEKRLKEIIVATKRCTFKPDEHLIKEELLGNTEIKAIASKPVVILYIGNEQSWDEASEQLLPLLPSDRQSSCILCSENCTKYKTLPATQHPENDPEPKSLGELIQSCLEKKVVSLLLTIEDLIQMYLEKIEKSFQDTQQPDYLNHTVERAPQLAIFQDIKGKNGMLVPKTLAKRTKKQTDSSGKTEMFRGLSAISFEIKGVFRQANLQNLMQSTPNISNDVYTRILTIRDVYGCGVMIGNLVVHLAENSKADLNKVKCEVIDILEKSESKYFANHLEVKKARVTLSADFTYESGHSIRVRTSAAGATAGDVYSYGTLGCFVREKNDSEMVYALTTAHIFPDGCDKVVEIARSDSPNAFEAIGNFSSEMALIREPTVDIAAVEVKSSAKRNCHIHLKNSNGCDVWQSVLYDDEARNINGYAVYKWGSVSNVTHGLVVCDGYRYRGYDGRFNLFIKGISKEFSREGDSGSAVCFDGLEDETVQILSLITGELTDEDQQHIYSCSVHLKKNLEELSMHTGKSFELQNP